MRFSKPKYDKPIVGCGVVRLGKNSFSVDLKFKNEGGKDTSKAFSFKFDDLPEDLPEGYVLKNGKEYFLNVRADESAINSLRPAKGTFEVVCTGIVKDDNEEYLVIERNGDFGPYWQTVTNLQVVSGDNEGIVYPLYLPFASSDKKGDKQLRFVEDDDGNMTIYGNPEKSRSIANLYDLIEYSGLSDVEIPFPQDADEQDILGTFSKALRRTKKKFLLVVEKGYIKSMASLDETEEVVEEEPEDVVEEPVVKKPVKKVVEEEVEEEPAPAKKKAKPKFEED